jgi:hypothetical protein
VDDDEVFRLGKHPEKPDGDSIDGLDNNTTLDPTFHGSFDMLAIEYEAIVSVFGTFGHRTLNIHGRKREISTLFGPQTTINDRTRKANPIMSKNPHPGPPLPKIHATCSKAARVSEAGVYMEGVLEDQEDVQMPFENGSSHTPCTLLYSLLVKRKSSSDDSE